MSHPTVVARPEYPRPHFDRSHSWLSLNGIWEFSRGPGWVGQMVGDHEPRSERIVVPFAWETEASGVAAHWLSRASYRRTINFPTSWDGQRIVLHFGAVHHHATIWVNGQPAGEHEGGYTPFEIDITDLIGDHRPVEVIVEVSAPVDKRHIAHGKQRSIPADVYDSCAFTPTSGIWQSVWLESRPATYIATVALTPNVGLDGLMADITVAGPHRGAGTVSVGVDGETARQSSLKAGEDRVRIDVPIDAPRRWTPEAPELYHVTVGLSTEDGADQVVVPIGLRHVELQGDEILLNGERLYVRGVLDQGYWPQTGLTAPSDEAFVADIVLAAKSGFNLIRKHLKLEDPRFFHHADRLGMLVWAEPASTGAFTPEAIARFESQIEPMIRRDANHPSIVIWGLYNEEWGLDWDVAGDPNKQAAVRKTYQSLKRLDTSRPVVDNSGWAHVNTDLVDWHIYDETPDGWSRKVRSLLVDQEASFPVGLGPAFTINKKIMADGSRASRDVPNLNSEFGGGATSVLRGWNLFWQTLELRRYDQLSGYVWTELYDIEHEMAGIYDSARHPKDAGGRDPAATNAQTVIIPDLIPVSPGRDAVADRDGKVEFDVRISHHGTTCIQGTLVTAWTPVFGQLDESSIDASGTGNRTVAVDAKADPYRLSEPVAVTARLPEGTSAARLYVLFLSSDRIVARAAIDVAS